LQKTLGFKELSDKLAPQCRGIFESELAEGSMLTIET